MMSGFQMVSAHTEQILNLPVDWEKPLSLGH
jgi:hypothetical protein